MSTMLLLRSILIGFSIAVPVGPIGVLVIRRTVSEGRLTGLITGLGAAAADAAYGAVGAFGLTLITTWLVNSGIWLRLIGGLFLLWLGIRTLLAKPATSSTISTTATHLTAFFTTFVLTLTNPLTILSFAAIFASLGFATESNDPISALTMVSGVFIGSALWWVVLSGGVALFRDRVTPKTLLWMNRLSGGVVIGFGLFALWSW